MEGQITRLKLIKRQGYGRAKFDLLRQRVLHTRNYVFVRSWITTFTRCRAWFR